MAALRADPNRMSDVYCEACWALYEKGMDDGARNIPSPVVTAPRIPLGPTEASAMLAAVVETAWDPPALGEAVPVPPIPFEEEMRALEEAWAREEHARRQRFHRQQQAHRQAKMEQERLERQGLMARGGGGNARWIAPAVDEAKVAAELGLDLATYLMLRALEQQDIVPEHYDLLLRLDEAVKPATLDRERLNHFPIQIYGRASASARNEHRKELNNRFGVDFWRIPLVTPADAESCDRRAFDELCVRNSVCSICAEDFEECAELRVLPCNHAFHRDCIDHWLLESSTNCPECKRDLRH
jgi:hypothetical protein